MTVVRGEVSIFEGTPLTPTTRRRVLAQVTPSSCPPPPSPAGLGPKIRMAGADPPTTSGKFVDVSCEISQRVVSLSRTRRIL